MIREAQVVDRVPYMLVIGQQEEENGTVAVRHRDTAATTTMTLPEFLSIISDECKTREDKFALLTEKK